MSLDDFIHVAKQVSIRNIQPKYRDIKWNELADPSFLNA